MNNYVVIVVPDEAKATEALHALRELHNEATVTLYGRSVVKREADGTLSVKEPAEKDAGGLGAGALVGALLGAFFGPAGAAAGLASGSVLGGWRDYLHAEIDDDFLASITATLTPGKYAVVAELDEDWLGPLDERMERLGGVVIRASRERFIDEMVEKRADANKAYFERRRAEARTAKAEKMKSKLEAKVDQAREKLQRTADDTKQRIDRRKQELEAKLQALHEQAAHASPDVRERIDQRIAQIRADFDEREKKLARAYELTQEALGPV